MISQPHSKAKSLGTQAAAILTGSFLTGAMVCLSGVAVPVFLDTNGSATHLLQQWVRTYHYGHIYMPAFCVGTCGLYALTALRRRRNDRPWRRDAAASAATLAMVPFTWLFMAPTNSTLFELEAAATATKSVAELEAVRDLIVRWGWLHVARSLFPLLGVLLGCSGLRLELGV